ncbi:MAG TPA: penicillin-binding transpeptidase domain-containing protein, partial [Candidatus Ozemobacteraceae bacterium]|nr:penicillin-binding transpeptidase domain-containing protein [Candidatus Ozemobacteraceae bacterium]
MSPITSAPRLSHSPDSARRAGFVLLSLFLLTVTLLQALPDRWPNRTVEQIETCFADHDAAFVLRHLNSDRAIRIGGKRTAMQLSPCSTFKIPHALIGLECGILTSADQRFPWDGHSQFVKDWERDHSVRSSMYYSVVPLYKMLATQIGSEKELSWLTTLDYGNRDISAGLTSFWLGTSLKISADEQIRFLTNLVSHRLPVHAPNLEVIENITRLERFSDGSYHGKTGSNFRDGKWVLGWWVGWINHGNDQYVFAANVRGQGASGMIARRCAEAALQRLGLLPTTREERLTMSYQAFDQQPNGWRAVGESGTLDQGCCIEAAKLIEEYLSRHDRNLENWQRRILHFHAGQMQAFAGEVTAALSHFRNSYDPIEEDRKAPLRWNAYVRATIAFLQRDAATLEACRNAML